MDKKMFLQNLNEPYVQAFETIWLKQDIRDKTKWFVENLSTISTQ